MFCESYRQPLTEAACSGDGLPRELAAHLDDCNACASSFATEQELFASIDRSLRAAANAEVPPSLVPRVRAQLASIPLRTFWRLPAIACATGGLALIVIGFVYSSVRSAVDSPRSKALVVASTMPFDVAHEPPESSPHVSPPDVRRLERNERASVRAATVGSDPEVLISSEERAEFERYVALLQARPLEKSVSAAAKADLGVEIKPLEIAELELRQLAIEPLEGGEFK
jgi:hypothetical protein